MRRRLARALESVWHEWIEAPWFVILTIVVIALVGPGLIWAAWRALSGLVG